VFSKDYKSLSQYLASPGFYQNAQIIAGRRREAGTGLRIGKGHKKTEGHL